MIDYFRARNLTVRPVPDIERQNFPPGTSFLFEVEGEEYIYVAPLDAADVGRLIAWLQAK